MGLFDHFPYTNVHELNLDWIMEELLTLKTTIEQFVSINALKYADPIQWNITSQYEKNTIVIDPLTGTAYISVQPVPAGVALTRTEYWTVVFDLGSFVVRAAKNFTDKYEEDTTLTATFPSTVNDWIIWGDTLYRVISNIAAGNQYVIDSNIKHFTIEDIIGHIEDLTTSDKSNIVAAINEVVNIIGSLLDLTTADKSSIVAAINELVAKISDIQDLIGDEALNTDAQTLTGAINEIFGITGNGEINELYQDLTDAINKLDIIVTPEEFGAVGDGVTDDSQAFLDAAAEVGEGGVITLSSKKRYLVGVTLGAISIIGNGATLVTKADIANDDYAIKFVTNTRIPVLIKDFKVDGGGTNSTNGLNGLYFSGIKKGFVENIVVDNVSDYGIYVNDGYDVIFNNIIIRKTVDTDNDPALTGYGLYVPASDISFNNVVIINFLVSIYDRGINMYDNIHAWIATAVSDTLRDAAIAVDFKNTGMYNNMYIDSIPTGFLFNDYVTGCVINNVHWLLFGGCDYILLKNNTVALTRLNGAVVNNIYLQGNSEPTQNYKIFDNCSPVITNVTPKFLDVSKTYGSVPHTINADAHFTRDIIRSIGEYIFVEFNISIDASIANGDNLVDLPSTPIRNAHYITCFINGTAAQMYVKNTFVAPQNLSASDEIIIRATIPRI